MAARDDEGRLSVLLLLYVPPPPTTEAGCRLRRHTALAVFVIIGNNLLMRNSLVQLVTCINLFTSLFSFGNSCGGGRTRPAA